LKQFALAALVFGVIARLAVVYDYLVWWQAILIYNAVLGHTTLELIYVTIPRFINEVEDRDQHFPAFRRLDCKFWHQKSKRLHLRIGSVTWMIPRIGLSMLSMACTAIFLRLFTIGYKFGEKPITGFRKVVIDFAYWQTTTSVAILTGARIKLIDSDCDYS